MRLSGQSSAASSGQRERAVGWKPVCRPPREVRPDSTLREAEYRSAMTFLTVVIILAPMYEDGNGWYIMLFTGSMLYHHFLNPVLAILSLVLFERLPRLPLRQVWWALVPTILYGLYDLHGNITGAIDGPYPFMRVYDQTIQETLMWFTIILVTNLLYAFLLWWLGGNGRKSKVGLEFRT